MEQNTMEQLMEFMKAQFGFLAAKMDANEAKRRAHHERKMT
jgi:hypothetical protein